MSVGKVVYLVAQGGKLCQCHRRRRMPLVGTEWRAWSINSVHIDIGYN